MALGDLAHQAEAQAHTAGMLGVARQAVERLEDALPVLRGNPGAVVFDLHDDPAGCGGSGPGPGAGLASNYVLGGIAGVTGNITPKAVTVSGITAADKVYDATTAAQAARVKAREEAARAERAAQEIDDAERAVQQARDRLASLDD